MADEGIFATTAEVERKAGKNVSTVSKAEVYVNQYMAEAESLINNVCRFNFSDVYSSLNGDTKETLKEISTNIAAIYAIQYDMGGFTSRIEAEDMINILRDAALRGLAILRDKKVQEFIRNA